MEYKFISHKQLVIRSNLIPASIAIIEFFILTIIAIGFGEEAFNIFDWILVAFQTSVIWVIAFIISHNSYRKIIFDVTGVGTKKVKIPWDEIKQYEIKEVKYRGFGKYFVVPETKYLDSMLYLYGKNGEKIKFALKKEHMEKMKEFANGKSKVVEEIANKTG